MARDAFVEVTRRKMAEEIMGRLSQISSSAVVIANKALELNQARLIMIAGVATGEYDQADVDKLDSLKAKVTALYNACAAYLA